MKWQDENCDTPGEVKAFPTSSIRAAPRQLRSRKWESDERRSYGWLEDSMLPAFCSLRAVTALRMLRIA